MFPKFSDMKVDANSLPAAGAPVETPSNQLIDIKLKLNSSILVGKIR